MTINDIFELEELVCLEQSFAELINPYYSDLIVTLDPELARLLVDDDEEPLALAIYTDNRWVAANFALRQPTREIIEQLERIPLEIFQESRSTWMRALREYYSNMLIRDIRPGLEDIRDERRVAVENLLAELLGEAKPDICLDCCCGSGVGAEALRSLGIATLAYDNDPSLLSLGFASGRLLPGDTMWIDGTLASQYISPVDAGVSLMLGDIASYNASLWEEIVLELLAVTSYTVITTATKPEIQLVEGWCEGREDRAVETFENEQDPIYDRWVCVSVKR